mgnify:CR=1 FL=1
MAWSATQWRDRLNDYSGSVLGTRSWGEMGNSQYQGKFKFRVFGGAGGPFTIRHRTCGTPTAYPKVVGNVSGLFTVQYRYTNFKPTTYYSYYSYYPSVGFYMAAGNATAYAPSPMSTFNYVGFSVGSSRFQNSLAQGTSNVYNTYTYAFYNYSPWGAGPYSAGANIIISNGTNFPYQRLYSNATGICP